MHPAVVTADMTSGQSEASVNTGKKYNSTNNDSPGYIWISPCILGIPSSMNYLSVKFYQIPTYRITLISDPHYLDVQAGMLLTGHPDLEPKYLGPFMTLWFQVRTRPLIHY